MLQAMLAGAFVMVSKLYRVLLSFSREISKIALRRDPLEGLGLRGGGPRGETLDPHLDVVGPPIPVNATDSFHIHYSLPIHHS